MGCQLLAGYTSYFLWIEPPNLGAALRRKAGQGCKIRFLVGDPDSAVTRQREDAEATSLTVSTRIAVTMEQLDRLRGTDGIEARFSDRHIALSVFAFDDDGIFDRFAMHVRALWDEGRDVWGGSTSPMP